MLRSSSKQKRRKEKNECLPWEFIKKNLSESKDDERVSNMFAMAIWGMVIFPKVLDHVEVAMVDLMEQVNGQANPRSSYHC